ncbi:MAG: DUF4153 domain-containing protein [Zoogloeaceae bacterium]|jgi:hypothetical protein|nr:DUF4153 domain-containing protein [Zoogloeaceae bacterium]
MRQAILKKYPFLLTGLIQGILLAVLGEILRRDLIQSHLQAAVFCVLFLAGVLMPLAFYCGGVSFRRRMWGVFALALLVIGVYQGWMLEMPLEGRFRELLVVTMALAPPVMLIAPGLAARTLPSQNRYAQWVESTLRVCAVLLGAGFALGLFWILLGTSSVLFDLIGIRFSGRYVFHLSVMASCAVFGYGVAKGWQGGTRVDAWFSRLTSLIGWIFPFAALIAILFVLSWTWKLEALIETHRAAFILLWFIALLAFFFNLQSRCGTQEPDARWWRLLGALGWLAAVPMLCVAVYGIQARIEQYGLTPDRVWAVFVTLIAAMLVFGYAARFLFGRRVPGLAAKTNIAAVFVIAAGVLAMTSGLLDPQRISVNSQLRGIDQLAGEKLYDTIRFFKESSSVYGKNALRELARTTDAAPDSPAGQRAQYAKLALENENNWRVRENLDKEKWRAYLKTLRVYPGGEEIPAGLLEAFVPNVLGTPLPDEKSSAIFWKVRFAPDESDSYVFLESEAVFTMYSTSGQVWKNRAGKWEIVGGLGTVCQHDSRVAPGALFEAVLADKVQFVPKKRDDILVGGMRITLLNNNNTDACER